MAAVHGSGWLDLRLGKGDFVLFLTLYNHPKPNPGGSRVSSFSFCLTFSLFISPFNVFIYLFIYFSTHQGWGVPSLFKRRPISSGGLGCCVLTAYARQAEEEGSDEHQQEPKTAKRNQR
jgi:hypothetical protein